MFQRLSTGLLLVALASPGVGAEPQESKSAPLARELALALDAAKLDSIAASDPVTGAFVAALYIPGTQLLVVSGKFPTPDIGTHRISKKEFRELYMDLMGASVPGSRQFAADVSCDVFVFKPDGDLAADSWENGSTTQTFEGHKKAKVSEEQYRKAYAEADAQYAHILQLLLAQAKPKSS
jgi:hypothetical protein